jgi:hypothetical protein
VDPAESSPDSFCRAPPISAARSRSPVHASSQIARTRADFERFSEMSENLETEWRSGMDSNLRYRESFYGGIRPEFGALSVTRRPLSIVVEAQTRDASSHVQAILTLD